MLPFGRNSWPSAAVEMLLGSGYRPIDSQSPTLNRPLCYECPNVRQGEGTWTLQRRPPARTSSSLGHCPSSFGAQAQTLTVGLVWDVLSL